MSTKKKTFDTDFLGSPPGWIIRKGSLTLFLVFVSIIAITLLIPYNEFINSRVLVTSTNPSVNIESRQSGRLSQIFVSNGDNVEIGKALGQISNDAYFNDVVTAKKIALKFDMMPKVDSIGDSYKFPALTLGSIQNYYSIFQKEFRSLETFRKLKRNETQLSVLSNKIIDKNAAQNSLEKSIRSAKRDLSISYRNHDRSKILYDKGVLSKLDLDESEVELLESRSALNFLEREASEVSLELNDMKGGLTNIDMDESEKMEMLMSNLESSRQDLLNSIHVWEELNILISPIKGKVAIMDYWSKNQQVNKGETLFSVKPENKGNLIGIAKVPIRNSGKVKTNQDVIIKLQDFPYGEWGALKGEVVSISETPKKEDDLVYIAYIKIKSNKSTFNKELELRGEMHGESEIILDKTNLFQRLFFDFRDLFIK